MSRIVWRVTRKENSFKFTSKKYVSWNGRFDDPEEQYRVLYCAKKPETSFREAFQDLRPDFKALNDYVCEMEKFGVSKEESLKEYPSKFSHKMLSNLILLRSEIISNKKFYNIESYRNIVRMNHEYFECGFITTATLRGDYPKNREITQHLSKKIFLQDFAGITYKSKIDGNDCIALFEKRASLNGKNSFISFLSEGCREMQKVFKEYKLPGFSSQLSVKKLDYYNSLRQKVFNN